ncbi:MAG TPA: peptidoglycan DD-metalloendopeptidase family protein [Acidimicrobiales bacterium]|nr:peptidoglycan DD-metalloendopeptidase family protein [Acidimicrobiales bacterium]
MDVRSKVVRRWAAASIVAALVTAPTGAAAAPGVPDQEPPEDRDPLVADASLIDVDVLVSTSSEAVATELADLSTQITEQLEAFESAKSEVTSANMTLVEADAALSETEFLIEEKTAESDRVVVDAFISPPSESALEVLSADSLVEVTVKETLLGMETDRRVDSLTTLAEALDEQEELRAEQEDALEAADLARAEAEAKLADLETTLSEQASFVAEVEAALAEQEDLPEPTDPEEAAARRQRLQEITAAMEAAKTARDIREAAQRAEEERQRKLEAGVLFCPVDGGGLNFIDSWGFARSGGRRHQGVDMMAAYGTPTVAPVSGQVVHRGSSLGGLSWYVYGDNGNMYYGTHLSGYANQGAGWVEGGTVIGYVGSSGNASASAPHLHFEIHPGGGAAVNPYPATNQACPR